MWLLAVLCAGTAALWVIRARLVVVRVSGDSMNPTLVDGDLLLAVRRRSWRTGSLVVFRTEPGRGTSEPYMIKRVAAVAGQAAPADLGGSPGKVVPRGALLVRGDAVRSLDSRKLGAVSEAAVVAVGVCALVPFRWVTAEAAGAPRPQT
ncbi:S24/S26 family peptidase [Microbispora amethystogenes]|uniref:S24/S26 family peptidase n=1 Tax=Microbispora amethystogenes TaxID=1427754 RepID=UPI0033FB283F